MSGRERYDQAERNVHSRDCIKLFSLSWVPSLRDSEAGHCVAPS